MTDRELMQQALEALVLLTQAPTETALDYADNAIDALRERLAQPEQEPVAEVKLMMTGANAGIATRIVEIDDPTRERLHPGQMLYTAPPQRKPLTDEQIERACVPLGAAMLSFTEVARAIEAAHGIKGKNT